MLKLIIDQKILEAKCKFTGKDINMVNCSDCDKSRGINIIQNFDPTVSPEGEIICGVNMTYEEFESFKRFKDEEKNDYFIGKVKPLNEVFKNRDHDAKLIPIKLANFLLSIADAEVKNVIRVKLIDDYVYYIKIDETLWPVLEEDFVTLDPIQSVEDFVKKWIKDEGVDTSPDWEDYDQRKYSIYYDGYRNTWKVTNTYGHRYINTVYATDSDAMLKLEGILNDIYPDGE